MIRHPMSRLAIATLAGIMVVLGAALFAQAQIPQRFENLKVLPRDIPRPALILEMREMAGALGVRCGHCHTGGDPETLKGVDFASDSLETTRVARVMMRMVREINGSLMPLTGRDTTRLTRVRCITCHHGARRPETLADTLGRALDQGGAPGVTTSYRALREQYYGRAVYDFGEGTLQWVADQASRRPEQSDAAIPLLELNLEYFPQSVNTRGALAEQLLAKGDTSAAVRRWEEALAIDPGNRWMKSRLEKVQGR